ncbi:MAG: N-formylglutamate amidohydrolase [Pseudomonadota bacterium]
MTQPNPGQTDFAPVERIEARPGGLSGVLLVCDHAANAVPPVLGDLGLGAADMARHIAYDIGARGVTLGLAERLGAAAVLSTYSRLVIDPNRGEDDPTLVMKLYDGSIVPGNRHAGPEEVEARLAAYHRPYHAAIAAALDAAEAEGRAMALVSVHSFTPQLRGRAPRPWHVGLLWNRDERLVAPLRRALTADPALVVGDNEPYTGTLTGDCMDRHGTARALPHVLIEIRNDLIAEAAGQDAWAARLAPLIGAGVAEALAET